MDYAIYTSSFIRFDSHCRHVQNLTSISPYRVGVAASVPEHKEEYLNVQR